MERETRVVVFESENPAEIQLIKSKLEDANISNFMQNSYMSFMSTPTAATLKLQVNLTDEKQAFEIIDAFLKESDLDLNSTQAN
ncbi:putative signal transducing protein [Frigoriflavimonas asaccharolytica]|uniref:DUF2007 domain-containing protein n=1 Tax=Frigoriflavimonas asaccharolytica TaxID=2735899 RepID=A0A8J8GAC3_9FLAO|nr:DUF2007 domain-containing protein [Frigoriflavimonas asaccharolytica]NRS92907.1 hypothetical protein [Frigoriflavimonas asaccharolytica]